MRALGQLPVGRCVTGAAGLELEERLAALRHAGSFERAGGRSLRLDVSDQVRIFRVGLGNRDRCLDLLRPGGNGRSARQAGDLHLVAGQL